MISGKAWGVFFKFEPLARWTIGYWVRRRRKTKVAKRTAAIGDSPVDEGIHKPSQQRKDKDYLIQV